MRTAAFFQTDLCRLVEEISRRRTASTRELAEHLGVTARALEEQVAALRSHRLVLGAEGSDKIELNPDFGSLIGIDMGASHIHLALADFSGKITGDFKEKIHPKDGFQKIVAQIKNGIQKLTSAGGFPPLRALAMGVPSPIDPQTNLVTLANNLPGWTNVNLKNELEEEFSVPVFLENDANMAALGEHWRGVAQDAGNFIFIALGTGIGAGIFVNGQIYSGHTGNAGELRLLQVEWQRWQEDFGDTGYFETYASGQGIARLGRELAPGLQTGSESLAEERDAVFVFRAFHEGNPEAREVLERIFTILGVGIANVLAVLDPAMVVLGGGISRGAPEFMLSTIRKVVKRIQPNCPPVCLSALEDKAHIYGAIFSAMMAATEAAVHSSAKPKSTHAEPR